MSSVSESPLPRTLHARRGGTDFLQVLEGYIGRDLWSEGLHLRQQCVVRASPNVYGPRHGFDLAPADTAEAAATIGATSLEKRLGLRLHLPSELCPHLHARSQTFRSEHCITRRMQLIESSTAPTAALQIASSNAGLTDNIFRLTFAAVTTAYATARSDFLVFPTMTDGKPAFSLQLGSKSLGSDLVLLRYRTHRRKLYCVFLRGCPVRLRLRTSTGSCGHSRHLSNRVRVESSDDHRRQQPNRGRTGLNALAAGT